MKKIKPYIKQNKRIVNNKKLKIEKELKEK
jgi:hypothetical protein